jgi:hypothetical protein
VKIHPANITMSSRAIEGRDPLEVSVIRRHIGPLPPHVALMPAESDISTKELFDLMDYCLTVRGTVGIEAASRGIPVLTGGTGRYDSKGFTVDSASIAEYLERVSSIQETPRLTTAECELAERFAYGMFLLRPLLLETVPLESAQQERGDVASQDHWYSAESLRVFAKWLRDSDAEDFMHQLPLADEMTCVS